MNLFKGLKGVRDKMTANDILVGQGDSFERNGKEDAKRIVATKQQHINLVPMDIISGYSVRPGFYEINGATPIPCGINFTISSQSFYHKRRPYFA